VVPVATKELTQIYPQSGWVEHDAVLKLANRNSEVAAEVMRNHGVSVIGNRVDSGISPTNATPCCGARRTGQPLHTRDRCKTDRTGGVFC